MCKRVVLNVNCTTNFKIVDDLGKEYSIDEAKDMLEQDKVEDVNLAFQRLIDYSFDMEKLKRFYKED